MGPNKSVEMSMMQNAARMISRNLKICLSLFPELLRLRRQLGYRIGMSAMERDTWKASHTTETRKNLKQILNKYKLPMYLLPFLEWLFLATDDEISRLKAYVRNLSGKTPLAYNYLVMPAMQFRSPFRTGWVTEGGYSVAIMTVEEPGYYQIWGTPTWSTTREPDEEQDFSPATLTRVLQDSGDFVVRGNLDLLDVDSWRALGKFLARVKKGKGMGKPLGLVAGRQKGAMVRRKRVLHGMSWSEIQTLVAEQPAQYNKLHNAYANHMTDRYREEFKQSHAGQDPPSTEQKLVRTNAISNFRRNVKRLVPPQLK